MKKKAMFVGLGLVLLVVSGVTNLFAGEIKGEGMQTASSEMPGTDAAALWSYIHSASPYWNWDQWPGKQGLYKGREPHGALLQTFVSSKAKEQIYGKTGMVSDQGIIVKENYTPAETLAAITVMYKVKGYNPEAGDWFWAKYGPDGKVMASGKVEMCIGCHGTNKENDYLMTGPIK